MKSILISIRKQHNDNIFAGKKNFEGRKTLPSNIEVMNYLDNTCDYVASGTDVKFFIYEPKSGGGCGKIVGEFVCDYAQSFPTTSANFKRIGEALCVSTEFAKDYFNRPKGYMIRICNPKRYDNPKNLCDFEKFVDCYNIPCTHCPLSYMDNNLVLNCDKTIKKPPQSWCYTQGIRG